MSSQVPQGTPPQIGAAARRPISNEGRTHVAGPVLKAKRPTMTSALQANRTNTAPSRRTPLRLAGVALVGLVLLLCMSAPAQADNGPAGATPPGKAWIRAGHFIPGMAGAGIDLVPEKGSGRTVVLATDATYGKVTSYQKVVPGDYEVTIRSAGFSAGSAPMLQRSVTVKAGNANTVALLGTSKQPRLAILTDDLTAPKAGTARVRVLSGAAVSGTVSVMAVNGPIIASDVVLGQATGYASVPAGKWTLNLTPGSKSASEQTVRLTGGSVYTVVALNGGPHGVKLKVITDAAGATATPKGGAETGLGGMAGRPAGASQASVGSLSASVAGGSVMLLLLAMMTGRLRRTAAARTPR